MPNLQIKGEDLSLPLPGFWWLPAILEVPWFPAAYARSPPLSSHGHLPSGCLCDSPHLLGKTGQIKGPPYCI